jgi:hypothetical protein
MSKWSWDCEKMKSVQTDSGELKRKEGFTVDDDLKDSPTNTL